MVGAADHMDSKELGMFRSLRQSAFLLQHPLSSTGDHRLGPLIGDELFRHVCRSRDPLSNGLDQPLRLAYAAREACLSPFHPHRLFARAFGEAPHQFLTGCGWIAPNGGWLADSFP